MKGKKIIIITVSVLLFLVIALKTGELWLANKAKSIIVEQSEKQGISTNIEKVKVNLLKRSVKILNPSIMMDSNTFKHIPNLKKISVKTDYVIAENIKYKKGEFVSLSLLKINNPSVNIDMEINRATHKATDSLQNKNLSGLLKNLKIENIKVENANINYHTWGKHIESKNSYVKNLDLDITDFKTDTVKTFTVQSINFSTDSVKCYFNNRTNSLALNKIRANSTDKAFSIDSIMLIPEYSKFQFAHKVKTAADWTEVLSGKIQFTGIDYTALIHEHIVKADSIYIENVRLDSYKNKQVEQPQKIKPLLHEMVQDLPVKIDIKKAIINNSTAIYEELAVSAKQAGRVSFTNLHAEFTNLTNIVSHENQYFDIDANCLLMGYGNLHAKFKIPVEKSNTHFEVQGKLGKFNMVHINPIIHPLLNVEVVSGTVNSMDIAITGNSKESHVNMTLLYNDLSVNLEKIKKDHTKKRGLATFFVDKILVKNNNPDKRGTRHGKGTAERNPYRSQFNYLWKSLVPGIKSSVTDIL